MTATSSRRLQLPSDPHHRSSSSSSVTANLHSNWDQEFDQLARNMNDRLDEFHRHSPRDFFRHGGSAASSSASSISGCRSRTERQPDGSLVFRVTFDVHGYGPDDLKTSVLGDRTVRVSGRAVRDEAGQQSSMSFEEQFTLPDNADARQLRSVVANNQLIISAPLLPPQYAIGSGGGGGGGGSATPPAAAAASATTLGHHQSQSQTQFYQQPQQQQQQHRQHHQPDGLFKLEIDIGAEFSPADIRVSLGESGRKLVVHGRRELKASGKTSVREFRDEYDLPEGLDVARLAVRFRSDGKLLADAPYKMEGGERGLTYHNISLERQ